VTEFIVAVSAAVAAVLSYVYFARRRGNDALGPRPGGSFPDTFPAFALAFLVWVVGGTLAASRVEGPMPRLLVIVAAHVAIAAVLWPVVARNGLISRIGVPRRVVTGIAGGLVVFAFTLALMALMTLVYESLGHAPPKQGMIELLETVDGLEWCVFAASATAAAPFAEEIIYRGALLPALGHRMSFTTANTIQALVFGLMHVTVLETLVLAIPLALVGAAFGWLYRRTGSLVTTIVAHSVFNALNFGFFAVKIVPEAIR